PLPVRQASALPAGFLQTRSRPRNPCPGLTLPLVGRVRDLHPLVGAPCRAHRKKRPAVYTCRPGSTRLSLLQFAVATLAVANRSPFCPSERANALKSSTDADGVTSS